MASQYLLRTLKYPLTILVVLAIWRSLPPKISPKNWKSLLPPPMRVLRTTTGEATLIESPPRIAIVCCGLRTEETLVLLKSIFLFSPDEYVEVYIIADEICRPTIVEGTFKSSAGPRGTGINATIIPYEVPAGTESWKVRDIWICTPTRLFLHKILPETDAVLYLDTDHIVLSSVTETWRYFENQQRRNPFAVVSLSDHVPPPAKFIYNTRDIPFFGNSGINAGTIFMNLTRMRRFQFDRLVFETYDQYKHQSLWGGLDQDIINIIFGTHRSNATLMECNYSFRLEHCGRKDHTCSFHSPEEGPVCFCWPALVDGVKLIHGVARSFHRGGDYDFPFLASLFEAIQQAPIDSEAMLEAIQYLKEEFVQLNNPCLELTPEALYRNAESQLTKSRTQLNNQAR